jgi:hypothetical protein
LRTAAPVLKAFIDQLTQDYGNTQLEQEIDAVTARAVANEETSPLFDLYSYFDDLAKSVSSTALADAARKAKDAMMKCKLNARGTKKTEEERLPSFNFLLGANGAWEDLKLDNDTKRLIYTATYNWDGTKQLTSYGADGKMTYQSEDKWGSTGDETYAKLRFEQLTGWSRWLKMNKQKPLSQYPK